MLYEAINSDIIFKKIIPAIFKPAGEVRDACMVDAKENLWPSAMATLEKHLPADAKFINGDSMTTHDFTVGSALLSFLENPNTQDSEFWADIKATKTPPRVLKYIEDLKEVLKDHMASRPNAPV